VEPRKLRLPNSPPQLQTLGDFRLNSSALVLCRFALLVNLLLLSYALTAGLMHPELSQTVVSETSSSLPLQAPPEGQSQQCSRFRRHLRATIAWVRGPNPPINVSSKPIFPVLQEYPSKTFRSVCKQHWHRLLALGLYLFIWLLLFVAVIHHSRFASLVEGEEPGFISCVSSYW
jgi:hypothetical protein